MVICNGSEILGKTKQNSHQNEKEYLRIENYDPRKFTELLIPEIITLLKLKHENIIKYYDYDHDDNFCINLEIELLTDSDELAARIKMGIKRDLLIQWFKQLIFGLKYLHSNIIVHNDLKPSNIFIKNNQIKIGRFDVFRKYSNNCTELYKSPEWVDEEPCYFKSDVWSLGVVFYEMVTKKLPFQNKSEIKEKCMPELPKDYIEYHNLLEKMVVKENSKRFNIFQVDEYFHEKIGSGNKKTNDYFQQLIKEENAKVTSNLKDPLLKIEEKHNKPLKHNQEKSIQDGQENGKTKYFKYSLSKINSPDTDGKTQIMIATKNGELEKVKFLIENKAKVNHTDKNGTSALMLACLKKENKEIVELLIQNKADVNANDIDGKSPLMIASASNCSEIVEMLLENGANVNSKDKNGITSLMWAALNFNIDIFEILKKYKVDFNEKCNDGISTLMIASRMGNKKLVKLLIDNHVDVNEKDKNGMTALMIASKFGHKEIESILLENQVDIKARKIALKFDSIFHHKEIVKLISESIKKSTITLLIPIAILLISFLNYLLSYQ